MSEYDEMTLQEKIEHDLGHYREGAAHEIEHLKKTHPEYRQAITITRWNWGALLSFYDLDQSDTEPISMTLMREEDWAMIATRQPGQGHMQPMVPAAQYYEKIKQGITEEENAKKAEPKP